jgi:hypothetical protein
MTKHYVWTRRQLYARGLSAHSFAQRLRDGDLHRVLPGVYCTRVPTTADRCMAVSMWRSDAVLSHRTALWLHGIGPEPKVIEAYVRELPAEPVPNWLRLRVPEYGVYDDTGGFDRDVVRLGDRRPVPDRRA